MPRRWRSTIFLFLLSRGFASADPAPWINALLSGADPAELTRNFPVESDWLRQDANADPSKVSADLLDRVIAEAPAAADPLHTDIEVLRQENSPPGSRKWLTLYAHAAGLRRQQRLATVLAKTPRIVFIKRKTIRPSFFAYTEGQSDAQRERHFLPGSQLCLLEFDGTRARVSTLLDDDGGVFRETIELVHYLTAAETYVRDLVALLPQASMEHVRPDAKISACNDLRTLMSFLFSPENPRIRYEAQRKLYLAKLLLDIDY